MSPKESKRITSAYKKEHKRLLGYIRKKIPVSNEAEDIMQDIFYQLTIGFNDIRRIESLTAWLYRVADNRITDLFRKRKHEVISFREISEKTGVGINTLISRKRYAVLALRKNLDELYKLLKNN